MLGEPGDGGAGLLIPVLSLRRQRQKNLCEFKALVVYRTGSRIVSKATKRNHVSRERQRDGGRGEDKTFLLTNLHYRQHVAPSK